MKERTPGRSTAGCVSETPVVTPLDNLLRPASGADVLDVPAAAGRLGLPIEEARTWLEKLGLIRRVASRERVVWAQLLGALQPQTAPERPWSDADLLSIPKTVKRLAMNERAARSWLVEKGLIRQVGKAKRVVWGDVLQAARGEVRRNEPASPPTISRPLPRSKRLRAALGR